MKEIINNIYEVVNNKFYFRLLYLFVSFTFVTILQHMPGIKILNSIVLAWGIILIIFMIFDGYKKRKIYKFDISLGFFMILTLILNTFVYRNIENYKIWIVNLILFLIIFSVDVFRCRKTMIKEMNIITYFYVVFMFIVSGISNIMRFMDKTIEFNTIVYGNKRGIFVNENSLAIAAAIAIVLSMYLYYIAHKHKLKMFLTGNIVLQAITMIGSDGRSAYLIVIAVIYTFIYVYNKNKYFRIAFVVTPILACATIFEVGKSYMEKFTTERSIIWDSAKIVIKQHSLSGVGNEGLVEAVKNAIIGGYLPGIELGGLHNIYVEIAAVNGVISLLLFIIFLGTILLFIVEQLDKLMRKEKLQMTTLASLLVGILAVNLFESILVYRISFISMIFWIYLGYLISILDNKNID